MGQKRLRGASRRLSAGERRVFGSRALIKVEVRDGSTVSNIIVDFVNHLRLYNSAVGDHLTFRARMPGGALNKTLTRADREEINLGRGSLELHGVFP